MTTKSMRLVIIKDYNFTLNRSTKFEYAELISCRIRDIGKTGQIYIPEEKRKISVNEYDPKANSEGKHIVKHGDEWFVVEDDTCKLAKQELNAGECPYLILRPVKVTDDTMYAFIVNPNDLEHPLK